MEAVEKYKQARKLFWAVLLVIFLISMQPTFIALINKL